MKIKISKITKIISIISLLFITKSVFAIINVNTLLGINNPLVNIIFTPPYSTGFYTSGNVYAQLTGEGIVAPLYMLTDNGTYQFNYRRGTGPYTTGVGYSSGNTWTQLSLIDSVTWIDKIPPTFSGASSGNTYNTDITLTFADNLSGVTATLNGTAFNNNTTITDNGTYVLLVTDIALNSTGATFIIDKTITSTVIYNPDYASGFFTSGNVTATITGFNQTGIVIDNNGGSFIYTFTGNGTFIFNYHDGAGNTGSTTATVTWIDKIPPTFSGASTGTYYPNNIGIIFDDLHLSGATLNGNPYFSGEIITGDGIYTFIVNDLAGNSTGITFTIDQTPPTYTGVTPGSYYSGDVSIIFSDLNLSGATLDTNLYTSGSIITGNGIHYFEVTDKAGNSSAAMFTIDKIPPTYSGFINSGTYDTDITIIFTDNNTGVTATLNGNPLTYGTPITNNGTYTLIVTDIAGNQITSTFKIDKNITETIEYLPGSGSITSGNVIATITGFNKTGITITNNGGSPNYIFTGNDNFIFTYQDGAGNTGSTTATVTWIDKIPPQYFGITSGATYTTDVTITFTDNLTGVTATLNGNPFIYGTTVSTNGTYTLIVTDIAGNKVSSTFIVNKSGGGGGGGGGGGTTTIDICENRSCNNSYYFLLCGPCTTTGTVTTGTITTGHEQPVEIIKPEIIITPNDTKTYSKEMLDAYQYAYNLGITTMNSTEKALLDGPLLRKHLAKMISEYAIKVVGLQPDNSKKCEYPDIGDESEEMKYYIRLGCKLGLMGLNADGITIRDTFMPNELVNRAQFGTVFSRLIFGLEYNLKGAELTVFQKAVDALQNTAKDLAGFFGIKYAAEIEIDWYTKHLNALKQNSIMTQINPLMTEIRGYVMTMMMRADRNGIIQTHYGASIPSNINN